MKTLQVVEGYPPNQGFVHRWAWSFSRVLAARGHAVQVITLQSPVESYGEHPVINWGGFDLDGDVRIKRCAVSAHLGALQRLLRRSHSKVRSTDLRRTLWRARGTCDVLHLHGTEPPHALWAWVCSRLGRCPLVVTPHLENDGALSQPALRWLLRHAEAVLALDVDEANRLRRAGVHPRRLLQIGRPAGVAAPASDYHSMGQSKPVGLSEESRLFVFAGPCDWNSGVLSFIDAVRLLRLDGMPAVAAVVADHGHWDDYMRRLWQTTRVPILELPVLHPVDRSNLLALAEVVVLPADWRTGDVHDAWVAGTPALAPHGRGRWFTEDVLPRFRAEDPLALSRVMLRLLRNRHGQDIVARGRALLARAPSWADVGTRAEALYRELAQKP